MARAPRDRPIVDWWMLLVGIVAVAVRLLYFFEGSGDPTFAHPIVDSSEYDAYATLLARGQSPWPGPFTSGWTGWPAAP